MSVQILVTFDSVSESICEGPNHVGTSYSYVLKSVTSDDADRDFLLDVHSHMENFEPPSHFVDAKTERRLELYGCHEDI